MEKYNQQEYTEKFGEKMWRERVINVMDEHEKSLGVDYVYATGMGNIFMIITKDEM